MPILFYYLEKLSDDSGDGYDGRMASSFSDSTPVFGHFVYRNWIGADIVKLEIYKGLY